MLADVMRGPPYLRPAVEPFLRQEIAKVKSRLDGKGPFDSVSRRRRADLLGVGYGDLDREPSRASPRGAADFPRPAAGASRFGG
jgi:hypothetical protein